MISRLQIPTAVKPGRMPDAIAQMQEVNVFSQRLAGVSGQMFSVSLGDRAFGGALLVWDFPSAEAQAAFDTAVAADTAWQALLARVVGPDSPWVLPAPRELLRQLV